MTKLNSLKDMLVNELRDLYSAENKLMKALSKMIKAAHSKELKINFEKHLEETRMQVEWLESIFKDLELPIRGKTCKAIEGCWLRKSMSKRKNWKKHPYKKVFLKLNFA